VLIQDADRIDGSSRFVRWVRRLLLGDLALLAAIFAVGTVLAKMPAALAVPAGVAFILMFLLGAVLGVALIRRRGLRLPAVLMTAAIPLIPLTAAIGAIAPDWAHPGYAESALYLGLALLARHRSTDTAPTAEERVPVATEP